MFVCDDESLYGIGQPVTYKDRGNLMGQEKIWVKLEKPHECSDYLKVVASGSTRLILTRSGQLFCQGENLRLYIDKDVKPDEPTLDFINCTEVFPIDDFDQIIDVAAGFFYTVVVTESGNAYAVGCDKSRVGLTPHNFGGMI